MAFFANHSPATTYSCASAHTNSTLPLLQICDGSSKQKSGYIDLEGTNKHLFYWFFESRRKPLEDPLILWLNGGPGCSSLIAVLRENGPCSINAEGDAVVNPLSWTNVANMLWVDQPVGVGFSYQDDDPTGSDGDTKKWDEEEVARDMLLFLQQWMRDNPKYRALNFYLMGESYAGHYIPNLRYVPLGAVVVPLLSPSSTATRSTSRISVQKMSTSTSREWRSATA
jgi:carboxypeptidase C (cathepsin A)